MFRISIHEYGDISDGCNAVGKLFKNGRLGILFSPPLLSSLLFSSLLPLISSGLSSGNIIVDPHGMGRMKTEVPNDVHDLLGRSVVLSASNDRKLVSSLYLSSFVTKEEEKTRGEERRRRRRGEEEKRRGVSLMC